MSWNLQRNRIQLLKQKSDSWFTLAASGKHKSDLSSWCQGSGSQPFCARTDPFFFLCCCRIWSVWKPEEVGDHRSVLSRCLRQTWVTKPIQTLLNSNSESIPHRNVEYSLDFGGRSCSDWLAGVSLGSCRVWSFIYYQQLGFLCLPVLWWEKSTELNFLWSLLRVFHPVWSFSDLAKELTCILSKPGSQWKEMAVGQWERDEHSLKEGAWQEVSVFILGMSVVVGPFRTLK